MANGEVVVLEENIYTTGFQLVILILKLFISTNTESSQHGRRMGILYRGSSVILEIIMQPVSCPLSTLSE